MAFDYTAVGGSQTPLDDFTRQSCPKATLDLPHLPQAEIFLQARKGEKETKMKKEGER